MTLQKGIRVRIQAPHLAAPLTGTVKEIYQTLTGKWVRVALDGSPLLPDRFAGRFFWHEYVTTL